MLLPPRSVKTNEWATKDRYYKGTNELPAKWSSSLTPYIPGIHAAADMAGVRVLAVEGNARSGKTVAFENIMLKRFAHGPYGDMLWYMQSADDVDDYMEERGEWNLENHDQIAAKIDQSYKRQSRARKKIGESLARWLAASAKSTRGKGAPLIIADEIDAYQRKILKGLLTLLLNRQREFGSAALLCMASHPDAGPAMGISKVIDDGIRHLWWWLCIHCGKASSPSPYATVQMKWNVPAMYPSIRGAERTDALEYARQNARLVCPHCEGLIDNDERKVMSLETGAWVQPQQQLIGARKVDGEHRIEEIMGFVIHGFMAPFVQLSGAAAEWVSAMLTFDNTQDDEQLRQVVVKTLGEVMDTADQDQQLDDWKIIRTRMRSGGSYPKKYVPEGVHFLVAFVDLQKRGFEVRVIGYNAHSTESWLIDAYLLGERREEGRNLDKIDPFLNIDDWDVLEDGVLNQSYPIYGDPLFHLPIAKVGIDTGGGPGATRNARRWASTVIYRDDNPVPEWRILLTKGNSHKNVMHVYGKARPVEFDDRGQKLAGAVFERTIGVNDLKKIVRRRQNMSRPGPGFMHAPSDLEDHYFRELTSERLVAGDWLPDGPNETWDAYVAGEVLRESMYADRVNWARPPAWARPFRPGIDPAIDIRPRRVVSPYQRMVAINRGEGQQDAGLSGSDGQ